MEAAVGSVTSILIYPIKSCRGISVSEAPLTSTGFRWDREWLLVNGKGRAFTQRIEPKLALVQVQLPTQAFSQAWQPNNTSSLAISAPGMEETLKVPLKKSSEIIANGVSVWEWSGSALDEGDEASHWFSKYLGKPTRLVRFHQASEVRPVDPDYATGYNVMFSDGYPFLLLSQGSLDALNALLKDPVPVNRFRPNILVDGCEPFAEDLWKEIRINNFTFHGVKLCSRCKDTSLCYELIDKSCCQIIYSLFGTVVARHLKQTSFFDLCDANTSPSCISIFQDKLATFAAIFQPFLQCLNDTNVFVINPSSCLGIKKVGSSSPLDLACNGDLTRLATCSSCLYSGTKVNFKFVSFDPNYTKCFYCTMLYAAGIVNKFGSEDSRTAACILGTR